MWSELKKADGNYGAASSTIYANVFESISVDTDTNEPTNVSRRDRGVRIGMPGGERDRNDIFRNSLTATCDDGTFRPASELEEREDNENKRK